MSSLASFITLPEELHILILSFLDHPRLLLTVSAVNARLHRLVGDDTLWHAIFLQYGHEKTPYEEQCSISFKELFKQRFVLGTDAHYDALISSNGCIWHIACRVDQNWGHSVAATNLQSIPTRRTGRSMLGHPNIHALVAIGGRNPVMAVAGTNMQVSVNDLRTKIMSVLPEEGTRALALVLDRESEKDEPGDRRRLTKGVSRGWGNRELRLVTGNQEIKVWTLPHRKGAVPLAMELASRIRCMRAVDRTHLLLTGCIDGSVKLWDVEHGAIIRDLDGFHDSVLCLDVYQFTKPSGDGKEDIFLAGGGSKDCTAKIWNLKTGETMILRGHRRAVHRILIDEDIVVAGAMDSTVRTWRLHTGEPLSLFTAHKTIVSHMSICTSPIRSLLTICFDGVAAIHTIDEEAIKGLAISRSPTRLNLARSIFTNVESNGSYFVVGRTDGVLSLFHLEPQNDTGGEAGSHITIQPIRAISTGLATIYRICVLKSGIVVGGTSRSQNGGLSFLYYNFAQEETAQKTS